MLARTFIVACLLSRGAIAGPLAPRKLDPAVTRAIETGRVGPWQWGPARPGRAPVLVELTRPATSASLSALAGAGAQLRRVDGTILSYDRFVPATLTAASAAAVAALP